MLGARHGHVFPEQGEIHIGEVLRANHPLAFIYLPWPNGACKRIVQQVVRVLKAMLDEEKRDLYDWISLVPAVQRTMLHDHSASYVG